MLQCNVHRIDKNNITLWRYDTWLDGPNLGTLPLHFNVSDEGILSEGFFRHYCMTKIPFNAFCL